MILVTGSTGLIGSEVVRLLSQAGASARALVRNPNKAQKLPGITWVVGDLARPETLATAFEGAKSVFLLTHYFEDMVELQHNAIVAARAAGVTHVVKVSAFAASDHSKAPIGRWHYQIEKELKSQQAAKAFSDGSDAFTSTVYEQAKSLQPVADKFKLTLQTATVTNKPSASLPPDSPLNNPKFLAAVFANDAVKDHNNTQAIDVGNNTLISARVTDFKPAATPPLASIKDAVRARYVAEQAAELARKDGAAKLADLQKSKSTAGFGAEMKLSRTDAQSVPPAALSAIFKADASKPPVYTGVDLGEAGYAIYRVNAVLPGAPIDPARLAGAQQQLSQMSGQTDMQAYIDALRARSKVKFYGAVDGKSGSTD